MKLFVTTILLSTFFHAFAQINPELRYADKIRIKEAINISEKFGDTLFEGFNSVPFAIILVTDSTEFLINHPNPSSDFKLLGQDDILKTNVYYRKTKFNTRLLATFPAVNGLSCIVVGTPENTDKNSSEWIITLLHEHFHQYQNAYPDYYKSADNLDLSGGDQTGMWMLNYPFPYDSLPVIKQFGLFTNALHKTITNIHAKNYSSYLKQYLLERKRFKDILSPADYRYFSFQIWQEDLARNTEYEFLKMLVNHTPPKEIIELPDFTSYSGLKEKMYDNETANLVNKRLNETKRISFYSAGFAEGLLLNKLNKHWRKKYLKDKFYIEHYSTKYK